MATGDPPPPSLTKGNLLDAMKVLDAAPIRGRVFLANPTDMEDIRRWSEENSRDPAFRALGQDMKAALEEETKQLADKLVQELGVSDNRAARRKAVALARRRR